MTRDAIRCLSTRDLLDYLLGREQTHDLAAEFAYVYDQRRAASNRRRSVR
jgi:hypothetical protein